MERLSAQDDGRQVIDLVSDDEEGEEEVVVVSGNARSGVGISSTPVETIDLSQEDTDSEGFDHTVEKRESKEDDGEVQNAPANKEEEEEKEDGALKNDEGKVVNTEEQEEASLHKRPRLTPTKIIGVKSTHLNEFDAELDGKTTPLGRSSDEASIASSAVRLNYHLGNESQEHYLNDDQEHYLNDNDVYMNVDDGVDGDWDAEGVCETREEVDDVLWQKAINEIREGKRIGWEELNAISARLRDIIVKGGLEEEFTQPISSIMVYCHRSLVQGNLEGLSMQVGGEDDDGSQANYKGTAMLAAGDNDRKMPPGKKTKRKKLAKAVLYMMEAAFLNVIRLLILLVARNDWLQIDEADRKSHRVEGAFCMECLSVDGACEEIVMCDGCLASYGASHGLLEPLVGAICRASNEELPLFCPLCHDSHALIKAVQSNNIEDVVALVWKKRANVYWKPPLLPNPEYSLRGESALECAARTGNYTVLQILLSGVSTVPPTIFSTMYNNHHSPLQSPIFLLPKSPKLEHCKLLLSEKVGGGGLAFSCAPLTQDDVSRGAESRPVPFVNEEDDEVPPDLPYINSSVPSRKVEINFGKPPLSCGACGPYGECVGAQYAQNKDKPSVFHSCSYKCGCQQNKNANDEFGRKVPRYRCPGRFQDLNEIPPLELFKTKRRGWGVRLQAGAPTIKAGRFVALYAGKIMINNGHGNEYSFEVKPSQGESSVYVDGAVYGNIARFINHACSDTNLEPKPFFSDHEDANSVLVAFFAQREIRGGEELLFAYEGMGNRPKGMDCQCGRCTGETTTRDLGKRSCKATQRMRESMFC